MTTASAGCAVRTSMRGIDASHNIPATVCEVTSDTTSAEGHVHAAPGLPRNAMLACEVDDEPYPRPKIGYIGCADILRSDGDFSSPVHSNHGQASDILRFGSDLTCSWSTLLLHRFEANAVLCHGGRNLFDFGYEFITDRRVTTGLRPNVRFML